MFNIESYITPILLSYVDKYVRDFKPADAQVSLWAGGVTLHNLVLKADVLQQEVALPFTLVSGRIHELLIQVPWTKIMSEPIVVTINTIECVLSLNPPPDESPPTEQHRTQVVEAPPGYMQALVRRIVSNIVVRINSLIVKYVHDDIVLSLNVKKLSVDSVGVNWKPLFAAFTCPLLDNNGRPDEDHRRFESNVNTFSNLLSPLQQGYLQCLGNILFEIGKLLRQVSDTNCQNSRKNIDPNFPAIRRLVHLDDLTLCLDKSDSDGKIRFYQEPLLYRCQLDLRVLTKLVSATKRRATSLNIQLQSNKLAWGVTNEQLVLLLRLLRERTPAEAKSTQLPPKQSAAQATPSHGSTNMSELTHSESWSDWAWSWLPAWDREDMETEIAAPPTPVPITFTAYFENISLVFKVMENEGSGRKRARGILELTASDAVVKTFTCYPSTFRIKFGTRYLTLASHGRCVCGHISLNACNNEPTIYLSKLETVEDHSWSWEEEDVTDQIIETAIAADELEDIPEDDIPDSPEPEDTNQQGDEPKKDNVDAFWTKMMPVVYLEYIHERTPSDMFANPFENPPRDYQYSDWMESNRLKVSIKPMLIQVTTGLLHRLHVISSALREVPPPPEIDLPMRVLTVEECDALSDNLPQKRISVNVTGVSMRVYPWDHSAIERGTKSPLALDVELPKGSLLITGPLYPYRVCSAACQMPGDTGPLWHGARMHVTASVTSLQIGIASTTDDSIRPCARMDFRVVTHSLLHRKFFKREETVVFSYTWKFREINICGSRARLLAAIEVPTSLWKESISNLLKHSTLATDVLSDEESVAVDLTAEEFSLRGFLTKNTNTHIITMHSVRATAFHARNGGDLQQAWIFSAPEAPTTTPYLRAACQWCNEPVLGSLEYLGIWLEPTALSVDPLLIAWLAYAPKIKAVQESVYIMPHAKSTSSQYLMRKKSTPPSSSGRGGSRSGSGAELVHIRPHSVESSSERSERRDNTLSPPAVNVTKTDWWNGDNLLKLHSRLNRLLITVETGLVTGYVTETTASAVDCITLRDAMERHALTLQKVLVFSFGRLSMYSSSQMKYLWHEIRHDGPTFLEIPPGQNIVMDESFPWKLRLADMSCYTLEMVTGSDVSGREKSASGLRSQLKLSKIVVLPKTVLEMFTTTVTLSVVTKSLVIKTETRKVKPKKSDVDMEDERTKFFTSGTDFKPSSLKEFIRGPTRRKRQSPEPEQPELPEESKVEPTAACGPVVSLGINLHADTPPLIVRLDQDQVQVVAVALHCLAHLITLLQRAPLKEPKQSYVTSNPSKTVTRSSSEMERQSQSEETITENPSEQLISIFESNVIKEPPKMKSFFWLQWVVSRVTVLVATQQVKLAFEIDDIISSLDLQEHYNQLKLKIASASIKHYTRNEMDEWIPGVLGGRVLEVREPADAKEENHFLGVTITQAQIANLPESWREELHPKLLDQNGVDSMWEVYATLAPLEVVLQPTVLEHIISCLHELAPSSNCPLKQVKQRHAPRTPWDWPYCYITAGGLRVLMTCDEYRDSNTDDSFMFIIGKVTVNPYPENPICRRPVNSANESTWMSPIHILEGRQYEILVKNIAIRSAIFSQVVNHETFESEMSKTTSGENPALKWSQRVATPVITPVLHPVDVGCVLAPPVYVYDSAVLAFAVELNIISDCAVELSIDKLNLAHRIITRTLHALRQRVDESAAYMENDNVCPYATLLAAQHSDSSSSDGEPVLVEDLRSASKIDLSRSFGVDSGVETVTSNSTFRTVEPKPVTLKKSVSIAPIDHTTSPSDYLEVLVTMGMIELSLYVADNGSEKMKNLLPPKCVTTAKLVSEPVIKVIIDEKKKAKKSEMAEGSADKSRSLTETVRNVDIGKTKLELPYIPTLARKTEGNIPLVHLTLHQPNLYFVKRKLHRSLQVTLFNVWVGLGAGEGDGNWNLPLVTTAKGTPDPVTDIPPALAMLRIEMSPRPFVGAGATNTRGVVKLDIERPILLEVSSDRLMRLNIIRSLMKENLSYEVVTSDDAPKLPAMYKLRKTLVTNSIESITIVTSQIGVRGSEGAVGWDSANLQLAIGSRPDRVVGRGLLTAVLVSTGPPGDRRHIVLQPLMIGGQLQASWDSWRRAEGCPATTTPDVSLGIDFDRITIDLRPEDLAVIERIKESTNKIFGSTQDVSRTDALTDKENSATKPFPLPSVNKSLIITNNNGNASNEHYYKDDLRSGAFKIVSGQQLPLAYQVTLYGSTVSWKYPHPRTITYITAYPIPGNDKEIECVLELYCPLLSRWETHTYFTLPLYDPNEIYLKKSPNDTVFALTWRVRACSDKKENVHPFEFDSKKFMPRKDPLSPEPVIPSDYYKNTCEVSAEQLSGVLRVDSYFAPRLLASVHVAVRLASLDINVYNDIPKLTREALTLEGYYVSRPLMKSHRVLTVGMRDTSVHSLLSPMSRVVFETNVTCDILDTSMGTMEQFIEEFRIQGTLSLTNEPRVRFRAGDVRVLLDVPRVCTTRSLANDWTRAYKQYIKSVPVDTACKPQHVPDDTMASVLDGRIGLWVHNKCSAGLRIGQEGTEEVMPLGSGVSLAYRWRSPAEPKNIRFALATPTTNWHWSTSVPFTGGTYRVTLEDLLGVGPTGAGLVLYVRVVGSGPRWDMYLTGRLKIANMTRFNLLYKVRTNSTSESTWPVISSGELSAECIGRSVLCSTRCEAVFKVKLACQESGWSGDIPLKECRKENVPWLVKVPTGGEVAYMSVWCRVTRARSDGRIIASIWPFYVLRSHLPLDTEVTIKTLCGLSSPDSEPKEPPAPIVQTAEGRGTCTHLAAPGTTAAHHMLTFQYKNLGCPVTREAIPLHYGVTDTSVFDKPAPTVSIEDIAHNLKEWIKKSGQRTRSQWPYSLVSKHWPDPWQPAILQPRSDITIRYSAVRIGGGCSLELHLCPVVLLANASPIALTLRAHDAAPLCKLEPGVAASLPSSMLQKAFFMSVEMGRETFVSGQLQVSAVEPGRYGSPPPGHIALDRASNFAIHCHQKVALLTMYYEIKENINVFGITSTFVLINRLQTELMVAAIAVPNQIEKTSVLRPKVFNVIQPTEKNSMHGTALGRFWVRGRWRGGDADELRTYLCLALPEGSYVASQSVPVRLGVAPVRRAIALLDQNKRSVPLVVSQLYHEGRWVITVADDPCPQFLVQNRTGSALAIAQPVGTNDEPSVTKVQAVPECEDALWWCSVGASSVTHYSTPAHCARYPPLNTQLAPIPFLTVGSLDDLSDPKWCQPVAVTDGEQLLQLSGGVTIKVRIRTYPHSTYIELLDVDQNDISASDIRRRLVGPFSMPQGSIQPRALGEQQDFMSSTKAVGTTQPEPETETIILTDKSEDSKSTTEAVSSIQPETSAATKLLTNKLKHSKSLIKAVEPTQPEPEAEAIMLTDKLKVDSKSSIASKDQILNDNQGTTTIRFDETRTEIADVDESHLMKLSGVVPEGVSDWSQIQGVVSDSERLRCVVGSVVVTFAASSDVPPLLSLHLDRAALVLKYDDKKMESELSILDVQIDNAQYETGQYDFGVVATTRAEPLAGERWAALWGDAQDAYSTRASEARLLINTCHDKWTVATYSYKELTEVEVRVGPLALYIEDSYISAALDLFRLAVPTTMMSSAELALAEFISLQYPLRLRKLYLHPLDLTLTLHTAVRMYIALDQSPLRLSAFQLQDVMTSTERLTHALTVHYLSAAILGAGWVVGGLELLGAPGALAARVGGASGGVRGVASAAAAALLKSLSACAGSLARNLDILAGDEEHARRAAAARRRPPPSLVAGLVAGITNFAINILGAVGGLAHHPLVGMAVGETESSTAALRRGLVGAITKPLSATADLVAYAGQGLLTQTGWDPVPQPRYTVSSLHDQNIGWRRDCVRWSFRLAELITIAGFEALVNDVSLQLLITHKFLVVVDPDTERIMEMIEFKSCSLTPYTGQVIELHVNQKHLAKISETQIAITDEDNDYQINVAAMARVARYTGAEGSAASETSTRVLTLLPGPGKSHALYALLSAALHHNNNTHFPLL